MHVLPQTVTFAEILELNPSAVFYSNGPGDPATVGHGAVLESCHIGTGALIGMNSVVLHWRADA